MYLCLCHSIKSEAVKRLTKKGLTYEQAIKQLKIGTDCGGCLKQVSRSIKKHSSQ
ncbi:MAG: (2Fe-2S)-binding protein [Bacteriovoracaceae bacterium]